MTVKLVYKDIKLFIDICALSEKGKCLHGYDWFLTKGLGIFIDSFV